MTLSVKKIILPALLTLAALAFMMITPIYLRGDQMLAPQPAKYTAGQDLLPEDLARSVSLSAGQKLALDDTYCLFFSNVPEMPILPGVLCHVDDVLPPSGLVRVLFSHMNLLIDWTRSPLSNLPATVGFAVENRTGRNLEMYAVRGAMGTSMTPGGEQLFKEDEAPLRPGDSESLYFGSAVGNYIVQQWFLSEDSPPVLLGKSPPGGRMVVSGSVGPRGWIAGMYDLKFVDADTGMAVGKDDLAAGESVGLKTFLAPLEADPDDFLDQEENRGRVLSLRNNDLLNMRGLFIPGSYPDNPHGEAVSKGFTVNYNAGGGKAASFALAAGECDQGEDPAGENYVPDVFLNDRMRNGFDPYARGIKAVNGGNYGVEYTVALNITGPVALVLQGAAHQGVLGQEAYIDLYNQILTVWIDGKVNTIQIRDPNYEKFYTDFSALRPPGYGRVIAVFNQQGGHHHLLRFTLPPNGYGPVRFFLLPM